MLTGHLLIVYYVHAAGMNHCVFNHGHNLVSDFHAWI